MPFTSYEKFGKKEGVFNNQHSSVYDKTYIPELFKKKIFSHIIKNSIEKLSAPLFLGIQGRPGEGKSFQTLASLHQFGVGVCLLSASQLSGSHEGDAFKPIVEAYEKASDSKSLVCIVIDDFDLSVASNFEFSEYTVNSQLLCGFLMNLSDSPDRINGKVVRRTPIIVTGNNLTSIYKPLVRHGRFNLFDWVPDRDAKMMIARDILGPYISYIDIDEFERVLGNYIDQPVSFFSSLRHDIIDLHIDIAIGQLGEFNVGLTKEILSKNSMQVSITELQRVAKTRGELKTNNYLKDASNG